MTVSSKQANAKRSLLSIIIPAYNVEDYILAAVESALRQTYADIEVIVVEDGSTDSTFEKLQTVTDRRVRIVQQKNRGLAGARNTGILESSGEYIGLLDGDDIWYPEKGRALVQELERDPRLGIAFSFAEYVDEKGEPTGQLHITHKAEPTLEDVIVRNVIAHPVVRRECFSQAGLFDESLRQCEDYEMWVRVLSKTRYKCRLAPQVLYGYRVRSGSLMTNHREFMDNANRVMEIFQRSIPEFNAKLKNQAVAEFCRITARRALSGGQIELAWSLMRDVFRQCPWLVFRDVRAFGTCGLIILEKFLPNGLHHFPYKTARILMKIFYRIYRSEILNPASSGK